MVAAAIGSAVVVLSVVLLRRRRHHDVGPPAPTGVGAALALVLEGDLPGAAQVLAKALREGRGSRADTALALVAVLRGLGKTDEAYRLAQGLVERIDAGWTRALYAKAALDAGRAEEAAQLCLADPTIPVDLSVASLCRTGQFDTAARLYRERQPRKRRESAVEGELLAGAAASQFREGRARSARKTLKKALALAPDGLLPLAVAARTAQKPGDRTRYERTLAGRGPGLSGVDPEGTDGDHAQLLEEARALWRTGAEQEALGLVRDGLDACPESWPLRVCYDTWLLEVGQPADFRAELVEVVELLRQSQQRGLRVVCTACGYPGWPAFYVCPRCDAIGTAHADRSATDAGPAQLQEVGVAGVLEGLLPVDPDEPGA